MRRRISLLALLFLLVAGAAPRAAAASWSIQPVPNPSGSLATLMNGVSCISSQFCIAVGEYNFKASSAGGNSSAVAERWNGQKWAIQKLPPRSGAKDSELSGILCTSSHFCIAVGSYTNKAGGQFTLAERWNGSKWSIQATPNPSNAFGNTLNGTSCASSTSCTAVGGTAKEPGLGGKPLAEHWNGTNWSLQVAPSPPGGTFGFAAVSCAPSACVAVGSYDDSSSNTLTFAEGWNGTGWSLQTTQNPGPGFDDVLTGVSCISSGACTADGQYFNGSEVVPLAERWDGTSWTVQSMPPPTNATGTTLQGISCASGNACTAVGSSFSKSGGSPTLAEVWNGIAWSIQKTPNPTGFAESSLSAVSCLLSGPCTAIGYKQKHASAHSIAGQQPLAEHHP